jgi:hypothetical protein
VFIHVTSFDPVLSLSIRCGRIASHSPAANWLMLWRDSPRHTHHRRLFRSAPINASGFIDQQRCTDRPRLSAVAYGLLYMAADTSSACQLCAGGVYSAQHFRAFALVRIWSGVCSGHIKLSSNGGICAGNIGL